MMVLVLLCIAFAVLAIGNVYKFSQLEKNFKKKLYLRNKRIIFVNNPDLDIKNECYQPESFFKMHNSGNNPCKEVTDFEYVRYADAKDYYL